MDMAIINRREMLVATGLTAALPNLASAAPAASETQSVEALDFKSIQATVPADTPNYSLVLEALVDVGRVIDIGPSPVGRRRIVNILGGQFAGPRLSGQVQPGGADRQIVRVDGVRQLHAVYELKTDDGVIISVSNRVIIEDLVGGGRYARSNVELSAPDGRYGWLNNRIFIGTLHPLHPKRAAVFVRIFEVG